MADRKKVIKGLETCSDVYYGAKGVCSSCPYSSSTGDMCFAELAHDTIVLLKGQDSLLGIQQTANSITFLSTGTARQGEERGLLLGKTFMHEWLKKELLYRGLLTDDIRTVFNEAENL